MNHILKQKQELAALVAELETLDKDYVVEHGKNTIHSDNYVWVVNIDLNTSEKFIGIGGSPIADSITVVDDFSIFDFEMIDSEGDRVKLTDFHQEIAHTHLLRTLNIE